MTKKPFVDEKSQFNAKNTIAFNPWIGIYKDDSFVVLLLGKSDRKITFYSTTDEEIYKENECKVCIAPKFVKQIDENLKIEGITDYEIDGKRGHLLLFNINSTPMYCITPEGQDLSEEVRNT